MDAKTTLKICIMFLATIFFLFAGAVKASAANFWLNPSTTTVNQGQNISISIGVNTAGESINAVQANLTYAADKFDYVNISTNGSALTIVAEKSGGGGQIRIAGGTPTPGFSGSKTIATLTLKAKVGSGSTQISFNGDSKILKNSDSQNVMTGSPAGIFNFGLVPTSTLTPFMATNKPTPTTQTNTPTFSPIKNPATLNPASIPIVTQSPKFYDNINVPILYGVIAVSLALAISGILYLILRRKIS